METERFVDNPNRFASRYKAGLPKVSESIINFATDKLLGKSPEGTLTDDAAFACLAVRIPLMFERRALGTKAYGRLRTTEEKQVESHLRLALSVDMDSGTIITTAPSEPLVTEAAGRQWENFNVFKSLSDFVADGYTSVGDCGEIFTALSILLALDKAASAAPRIDDIPRLHTPVKVTEFLKHFLAPAFHGNVLNAALPNGTKLEDYFRKAVIHCTHFIRVRDNAILTTKFIARCAERGIGIICAEGEKSADLFVPVSIDGSVKPEAMTGLKYQTKNRGDQDQYSTWGKAASEVFCKLEIMDDGMDLYWEPVNILVSYGAPPSVYTSRQTDASRDTKGEDKTGKKKQPVQPLTSFNIFVGGRTREVYPVIEVESEGYVNIILRKRDPYEAIYSQSRSAEDLLRAMQPAVEVHEQHWKYRN
jgi:hypothetical protein